MRKIIVVVLIAILLAGTSVAYAWWDNQSQTHTETIQIGEGVTLTVNAVVTTPENKVLVPLGVTLKENDVNQIDLSYNVKLDSTIQNDLNLIVESSNVFIGGLADHADLVNIEISQASETINGSDVLVNVVMTLTLPATEEIYNQIKNQSITFDLTFRAE